MKRTLCDRIHLPTRTPSVRNVAFPNHEIIGIIRKRIVRGDSVCNVRPGAECQIICANNSIMKKKLIPFLFGKFDQSISSSLRFESVFSCLTGLKKATKAFLISPRFLETLRLILLADARFNRTQLNRIYFARPPATRLTVQCESSL